VFGLVNSAVNTALPAFAAERRAAALLLLSAVLRRCCCWAPCCGAVAAGRRRLPLSINLSCSRGAQLQMMGQTDRQTDAPPLQRSCPADYAGAAKK